MDDLKKFLSECTNRIKSLENTVSNHVNKLDWLENRLLEVEDRQLPPNTSFPFGASMGEVGADDKLLEMLGNLSDLGLSDTLIDTQDIDVSVSSDLVQDALEEDTLQETVIEKEKLVGKFFEEPPIGVDYYLAKLSDSGDLSLRFRPEGSDGWVEVSFVDYLHDSVTEQAIVDNLNPNQLYFLVLYKTV